VHPHYHLVVLDGVFGEGVGRQVTFHEASELSSEYVQHVEASVQRRVLRHSSHAVACSTRATPTTCSLGKAPVDSVSTPRSASRVRTEREWSGSSNARLRAQVVALGRPERPEEAAAIAASGPEPTEASRPAASPARIRWAVLLALIYEVLPLLCPARGGEMKVQAFLTDPPVVSAILLHLAIPHRAPPLSPARGPPQIDLLSDEAASDPSHSFDPSDPEPVPECEFDQSVPDEFDR